MSINVDYGGSANNSGGITRQKIDEIGRINLLKVGWGLSRKRVEVDGWNCCWHKKKKNPGRTKRQAGSAYANESRVLPGRRHRSRRASSTPEPVPLSLNARLIGIDAHPMHSILNSFVAPVALSWTRFRHSQSQTDVKTSVTSQLLIAGRAGFFVAIIRIWWRFFLSAFQLWFFITC